MVLQLSGQSEPRRLYQEFYGSPLKQMPLLMKQGFNPISVAGAIGRRESAPADVIDEWRRNYIFTGDGVAYDRRKNAKFVLDAALLREMNPNTKLDNYAMILSNNQWEELHGEDVLYLSADKVGSAHKKGFVKRNGVWQPENTVVGDVWEHLSRGKDLKDYAEIVSEASNSEKVMPLWSSGNDRVMGLWFWFDRSTYPSPVIRSLVVNRSDVNSYVSGTINLDYDLGRLVGVAPEAQSRAKTEPRKTTPYR